MDLSRVLPIADKPTFEYQSCTNLPLGSHGAMAGHFTFVEGTIANPTGPAFEVEVSPLLLKPSRVHMLSTSGQC